MLEHMSKNWWILLVRGIFAIIFGILAFVSPAPTILALLWLIGAYLLADGVFALISAFRHRGSNSNWWVLLLQGITGILAGIGTFVWPGLTAIFLIYMLAFWALFTGVFEIVAAIRLRKEIEGEWLLALGGILSVLFGLFMFIAPAAGVLALVWIIGSYAILFGVLLIVLAFRMRGAAQSPNRPAMA